MALSPEVDSWRAKADEDMRSARRLLQEPDPIIIPALFHLQQACEKLLKGRLIHEGIVPPRAHDLTFLLGSFPSPMRSFVADNRELMDSLTPFAVSYRYPGEVPLLSLAEANALLVSVEKFQAQIF